MSLFDLGVNFSASGLVDRHQLVMAVGIAALTLALSHARPVGACISTGCVNHMVFWCCGSVCGHGSC